MGWLDTASAAGDALRGGYWLGAVDPAFGVVFEEDAFDEFADEVFFVGVEAVGGFELEA